MIEAHSAFFSMSPTEAFCTLRILPRIGSSAWNSESRAVLGRAQRGVALDDEQLGPVDVGAAAVGQLGRQRRRLERVLPPLRLPVLARGHPGPGRAHHLLQHGPGLSRASRPWSRPRNAGQLPFGRLGHQPGHGRRTQHLLGLALELRLGQPHGDDRGHPLEHVVLDDVLPRLEQPGVLQGAAEGPGQRPLEAGDVGAALRRGDDVDVGLDLGVVASRPSAPRCRRRGRGRRRSAPCARRRPASARSR